MNSALAGAWMPFEAETVNVKLPAVAGIPESAPPASRPRPGGSAPAVTAKPAAGLPVPEPNAWAYASPTRPAPGAGPGVAGAAPSRPSSARPQQMTAPSVRTPHVCHTPALTAV